MRLRRRGLDSADAGWPQTSTRSQRTAPCRCRRSPAAGRRARGRSGRPAALTGRRSTRPRPGPGPGSRACRRCRRPRPPAPVRPWPWVHLEERAVQVQVVDAGARQVAAAPGVELGTQALADPAGGAAADARILAEELYQHGLDIAVGQARTQQEITRVSSALLRVTPWPNSRSHRAACAWRSLGRWSWTGPREIRRVRGCCQPLR